MMLLVVECDPYSSALRFPAGVPDCRDDPFYEDRVRLYSRSSLLPASMGRIEGERIVVAQRAIYIDWARRLGRTIRILIVECDEIPGAIAEKVRVIPERKLRQEREEDDKEPAWQLYRFRRPLTKEEKAAFAAMFQAACSRAERVKLCEPPTFFDDGRAVEMLVFIPPFDDESGRCLLSAVIRFHTERVKIIGFNGSRWIIPRAAGVPFE
ncbi:MAG: hypothetical protein GY708_20180 [Actinomycetia bacterium]|nr:hypothetical protein [Actinomycetes bacterium]